MKKLFFVIAFLLMPILGMADEIETPPVTVETRLMVPGIYEPQVLRNWFLGETEPIPAHKNYVKDMAETANADPSMAFVIYAVVSNDKIESCWTNDDQSFFSTREPEKTVISEKKLKLVKDSGKCNFYMTEMRYKALKNEFERQGMGNRYFRLEICKLVATGQTTSYQRDAEVATQFNAKAGFAPGTILIWAVPLRYINSQQQTGTNDLPTNSAHYVLGWKKQVLGTYLLMNEPANVAYRSDLDISGYLLLSRSCNQ